MKKAKPTKGSARTKRFDAGGLAALAGLGTLAYLMSRKKKGEEDKGGDMEAVGGAGRRPKTIEEQTGRKAEAPVMSDAIKRAMDTSQGRPSLIPEGATDADRATMYGDTVAKRVMPAPRRAAKLKDDAPSLPPKKGETRISTQISPPAGNENRPSKPYPKDVKGTTPSTYYTPSARSAASMIEGSGESRKQRLGATYAKQYSAYQNAPAGADKEALKKSMEQAKRDYEGAPLKKGGAVKKYAAGGKVSSASKRADGIAQRGKTRGRVL